MNKDIMYAYCDTCKCITPKELRVTETVCIKCKTKVIDDAEELFGQLEDSYDKR